VIEQAVYALALLHDLAGCGGVEGWRLKGGIGKNESLCLERNSFAE
jgi:hypothetical protein